ncbi:MAG: YceI family protein [Paracoccaceae bacterium]|nr:YceI family protein [Paracoccaceae bacterium]
MPTIKHVLGLALSLVFAAAALAAPVGYVLQPEASIVGFEADFGPDRITGQMPVTRADLVLDFADVTRSRVAVTLDASGARASFPFAAQAMKGPKVLDAANYPQITFQSTSVRRDGDGARVEGALTIRGITRPVVLQARIWRQQGSAETDLSRLTIRLTGTVIRSDYGALGWADMVGDAVRLDILARIAQVN